MTTHDFEVGDFISYTLVTDTVVMEVVKTTPATMTVRRTTDGAVVKSVNNGSGYPVVHIAQVADPGAATRTVRRRKDGTFRVAGSRSAFRPAATIDGAPARRVDYSF